MNKIFIPPILLLLFYTCSFGQPILVKNGTVKVIGSASPAALQQQVDCTTPPIIDCPPNITLCPGATEDPNATGCAKARPGHTNCRQPLVRYIDRETLGNCPNEKIIQRIWIAEDPDDSNVRNFCIQYINYEDKQAPVFHNCPPDVTLETNEKCALLYTYVAPLVSDNCGKVCLTVSHPNGSMLIAGVTNITFTAIDDCGNIGICSYKVTVIEKCCNEPPRLEIPRNFVGCPDSSIEPSTTGRAVARPATANCKNPILTFEDDTIHYQLCSLVIYRLWIARDPDRAELVNSLTQIITLQDKEAPVIICPNNIIVNSDPDCLATVNWNEPRTTDNCKLIRVSGSHTSGTRFPVGIHVISFEAEDACGNKSNCSFTITVVKNCCNKPPVLNCPSDYFACPGSVDPIITGIATGHSADPGCADPLIHFVDDTLHSEVCLISIVRTWVATDPEDSTLVTSCTQRIVREDKLAPTIQCPADITVVSDADCFKSVTWPDIQVQDHCSGVRLLLSLGSGTRFPVGTTTVFATAIDSCGNSSGCQFNVTVIEDCCNEPPLIECPSDYLACPTYSTDPNITGQPLVRKSNPKCQDPIVSYRDDTLNFAKCVLHVRRTWTARDPVDQTLVSSCTQNLEFYDNVAPTIVCPADIIVVSDADCFATVNWPNLQVSDQCSSVQISLSISSGSRFPLGTTTVVGTAVDSCGNTSNCSFTVTVIEDCCNQPPIIHCPANFSGCPLVGTNPDLTGRPTVEKFNPKCDDPVVSYSDDTLNLVGCVLHVRRTWTATDPRDTSLIASCTQEIQLSDNIAPEVFCPADITVNSDLDCGAFVTWADIQTTDNCSTVQVLLSLGSGSRFPLGTTTVFVTAMDACGNSKGCTFNVTVLETCCNKPPVIVCPNDFLGCPGDESPSRTGVPTLSKSNPTCGNILISYADEVVFELGCLKIIERTWTAQDSIDSSLQSTCVQTIRFEDEVAPVFNNCPADITVDPDYNCDAVANWNNPDVQDNCSSVTLTSSHPSGSHFPIGTTRVTLTATDACGNSSTCQFNITVTEECCRAIPVIQCPADFNGCPGTAITPNVSGTATALAGSSYCLDPDITFTDTVLSSGPCVGALVIKRTWKATDPILTALFAECVQIITLHDTLAPVFSVIPSDTIIDAKGECEIEVRWLEPVVTDNCGIQNVEVSHQQGFLSGAGTYTISYRAIDLCGNEKTISFQITIINSEISVECPADITIHRTNPFLNGAYTAWDLPVVEYCSPCVGFIPGFIYMGEYNGKRYFCSLSPETWDHAKNISELNGGKLAVIRDQFENQFVASKLMGQTAWIGGTDRVTEGKFEWIDGSPFIYTNWQPGQPNAITPNDDYIEMFPDGSWNDQNGNESREFVMEIPCYTLTQISGPQRGGLATCGNHIITYVASKNGNQDTCSFNLKVDCDSVTRYCPVTALNSSIMWIKQVEFSGINQTSGNDGGYHFYTSPCGQLRAAETYPICLTPGFRGKAQNVYWKAWIDYNGDGVFHNTSELILYGIGNTTVCGNITVPGNVLRNEVRMRVAMAFGNYPADPCTNILYGEVEDYCIQLIPLGGLSSGSRGSDLSVDPIIMKCVPKCLEENEIIEADPRNGIIIANDQYDVILMPNPANQQIKMEFLNGVPSSYTIYDATGKQIWYRPGIKSLTEDVDLDSWSEGMYHLKVDYLDGSQVIKRFIVQR